MFLDDSMTYKQVNGKQLKRGYTTGSCAAAAAKGAVSMLFAQREVDSVHLVTPNGQRLQLKNNSVKLTPKSATCYVVKDAGDDLDVTHGIQIYATAVQADKGINIEAGAGIGVVTKPGLAVAVGNPAINPVPMEMILVAIREVLPEGYGVTVKLEVPEGEKLSKRTLNPELGIKGGISILGTTGIVEPMSEEAFKESLVQGIDVVRAQGYKEVVFTPGKIGYRFCTTKLGLNEGRIVQTSNFFGYMLEMAAQKEVSRVLIVGHVGKIVKLAAGVFQTHNKIADARLEVIAMQVMLSGGGLELAEKVLGSNTAEEVISILAQGNREDIWFQLAERASFKAERYIKKQLEVGVILLSLQGEVIGYSENAISLGERMGWQSK
ncbi:cobalt-precorrin-5B (C1)-methyltransferase [Desulfitispora alkaliphila]|uniref:cobalt-precorrin-5B (C(1))-methyltransferase CbiD n=1 Tax=Desulfitispora alkaliphila TaxID=622674 RepID=UPI003D1BDCA1